jgi:hypothetical protein
LNSFRKPSLCLCAIAQREAVPAYISIAIWQAAPELHGIDIRTAGVEADFQIYNGRHAITLAGLGEFANREEYYISSGQGTTCAASQALWFGLSDQEIASAYGHHRVTSRRA